MEKDNEVTEVYMMSGKESYKNVLDEIETPTDPHLQLPPSPKNLKIKIEAPDPEIKSKKKPSSATPKASILPNQTFEYIQGLN